MRFSRVRVRIRYRTSARSINFSPEKKSWQKINGGKRQPEKRDPPFPELATNRFDLRLHSPCLPLPMTTDTPTTPNRSQPRPQPLTPTSTLPVLLSSLSIQRERSSFLQQVDELPFFPPPPPTPLPASLLPTSSLPSLRVDSSESTKLSRTVLSTERRPTVEQPRWKPSPTSEAFCSTCWNDLFNLIRESLSRSS